MCAICEAMGQRVEPDGTITIVGPLKSEAEIVQAFVDAGAVIEEVRYSPNNSARRRQRKARG